MSAPVDPIMELPQNSRAVVNALETISVNLAGFTEAESWQTFNLTRSEYNSFYKFIRRISKVDLYDTWNSMRYDYLSRHSILTLRLPSFPQVLFTASLQDHISKALFAHANAGPDAWFLEHIVSVNAERDAGGDARVFGVYHPDLAYYFSPDASRPSQAASGSKRPRHAWEHDPTLIIEVCSAAKHDDMGALAERYADAGNGSTRTVVAIDTTRGVFSVWRYLKFLPTLVDGKEYRRCFQTEKDVAWRGAADAGAGLVLKVRDFMPTNLPTVEDLDDGAMEALMKKSVAIDCATLTRMWEKAKTPTSILEDEEGSEDMECSDTEEDTQPEDEEELLEQLMAEMDGPSHAGGVANFDNWVRYDQEEAGEHDGEDMEDEEDGESEEE